METDEGLLRCHIPVFSHRLDTKFLLDPDINHTRTPNTNSDPDPNPNAGTISSEEALMSEYSEGIQTEIAARRAAIAS